MSERKKSGSKRRVAGPKKHRKSLAERTRHASAPAEARKKQPSKRASNKRSASPRKRPPRGAAALALGLSQKIFAGIVRISGNQSLLLGRLLLRAGVSDFPSAIGAATQYLLNNGIGNGDKIAVAGQATTVEQGGQSIAVIVMTSAQKQ
jgi:hypothetical protein